ncbi:MAG: hypothetical protein BRC49_10935 [Cyanobacteria bacterium SW_10_48_33]|nr:MAG: hypothetical protein BRC49_10935 [Cyanobacteria bacterium SW_10_48_33]
MKLHYYSETDTLSIGLKEGASVNTEEMAHDVVVEFDADGSIISIDIDLASKKLDLDTLEIKNFPGNLIKTA